MKKLLVLLMISVVIISVCINIPDLFKSTTDENSDTINVKPDYSTPWKWRPLKAEELFEFTKLYTDEYAELFEKNNLSQDFEIQYACIRENEIYIYTVNNRLLRFEFSDNMWQLQKNFTGGYTGNLDSVNDEMEHRLTGDELYELYLELNNTEKLYDGYQSGNYYILYSYDYVYYVKREKEEYIIVHRGNSDWAETNNIYTDEGLMPEMQYTVNYNCLPNDESKSKVYNDAINAYNEYIAQMAGETLEWFSDDNRGLSSPFLYVYLRDLHDDGIPEIIVKSDPIYPYQVFSYVKNTVVDLAGPKSNNMHGGCYLLENGMYASQHTTTGWFNSFVTYNSNGTETIEYFSYYGTYSYKKEISGVEIEYIEFENTEEGKQQFYDMYAPYAEALEHHMNLGESYAPFDVDTTYNYSPYVTEELEQNG